ncbi:MAG: mechanosensitive ion channel family protein [Candidatus Peregrinibacteria bacterium]
MKRPIFLIIATTLFLVTTPAFAQIQDQTDYTRLQWRYDSLLKAKTQKAADAIQQNITAERTVIQAEIRKDLDTYVKSQSADTADTTAKAIERQRTIVTTMSSLIDETKVDISLFEKEEKLYRDWAVSGTGAPLPGQIMLTKNEPELLAKQGVLEERLSALQAIQKTQQDRLNQFSNEQQLRTIGLFVNFLLYLAIFLGIFWAERMIRLHFFDHIPNRRLRYMTTKFFSFIVYVGIAFWLIQKVFSDPSVVTVFALVGAALVIVSQDMIKGLIGWVGARNIIALGQRVTIGNVTGDVVDIGLLYTTILLARTEEMAEVGHVGQLMRIPNEKLLSQPLINWHSTSDFENVEIPVLLKHMSQSDRAFHILDDIVKHETASSSHLAQEQNDQRMRGYAVSREHPSSRVYMELTKDGDIELLMCFPAPIGQRRAITTLIIREILRKFLEEGIELKEDQKEKP